MNLSLADTGACISARMGELLTLNLDENPSTGYRWVLLPTAAVVLDADRLQLTGLVPGSGAQRSLSLRAVQPGEHRVCLRCERSWEGAATAVAHFEVTLSVA